MISFQANASVFTEDHFCKPVDVPTSCTYSLELPKAFFEMFDGFSPFVLRTEQHCSLRICGSDELFILHFESIPVQIVN